MSYLTMKELISNAALLLSLSIVYELGYFIPEKLKRFAPVIRGLLLGFIAIAIMSMPYHFQSGIMFDTRSILLCLTALIFGAVPAWIAAAFAIIFRIIEGGIGIRMGIPVILVCTIIGLLWRRYYLDKKLKNYWLNLYLFGLVVHIGMFTCTIFLPRQQADSILQSVGLPVMLIYPVVTVLLALLLLRQQQRNDTMLRIVEAEGRYRSLFDNNHAVMMLIDPEDGHIIDVNPAASKFYGWSVETMKTMKMSQINGLPPEKIKAEMEKALSREKGYFQFQHKRAFGHPVDVEVYSGPIQFSGKTVLYSFVHDISERVAADRAKEQSEQRFKMLIEGAPDAIFIQTNNRFAYVNPAAVVLYGASRPNDLLGTNVMDRFHPDFHPVILQRIKTLKEEKKSVSPLELIHIRLDGSAVHVDVTAVPINFKGTDGALVFVRDITERIKLQQDKMSIEAQLRQNQKMEAIGTLAGGVAHEINNPINGIMNYAQLILDELPVEHSGAGYAKEIIHETERISSIVRNLLQFSRQEKQSHSYACTSDIIYQTISLINTIIKKDNIVLNIDLEKNLPEIKCRSQQIQQVLMNLLTNARDALNEKYPGFHEDKVINLSCVQFEQDGRRWIRITVEDHGLGIPTEIRDKIYEPFFSTKPKDKGTGLGLSISFGLIKDHHGKISIESEQGKYTKFLLDLPVDNGWTH